MKTIINLRRKILLSNLAMKIKIFDYLVYFSARE